MSEVEHTVGNATSSHPSSTIADSKSITEKPNYVKKILSVFVGLKKGQTLKIHYNNSVTYMVRVF